MILIRLVGIVVGTETLIPLVVIVIDPATAPAIAFDTEMIVPLSKRP